MKKGIKINKIQDIVEIKDYRKSFYFSILECPDGKTRLYRNNFSSYQFTDYFESDDGRKFKPGNIIIKNSCANHNFSPFLVNNKYYGIGGQDSWKNDSEWHNVKTFDEFKKLFRKVKGCEYERTEDRWRQAHKKLGEVDVFNNTQGLYLFESKDGINWNQKYKDPIVTAKTKGFNSSLDWKSAEFDGLISVIYDGEYKIYLRENVAPGVRFVQVGISNDLIDWRFRRIGIELNQQKDNYYYGSVFMYNDYYIGMFPYYNRKQSMIKIFKSKDGINFNFIDNICVTECAFERSGKRKNKNHIVNGITRKGDKLFIYIHENYYGMNLARPIRISKWEVENLNEFL